jgi:hypothetical protein
MGNAMEFRGDDVYVNPKKRVHKKLIVLAAVGPGVSRTGWGVFQLEANKREVHSKREGRPQDRPDELHFLGAIGDSPPAPFFP